MNLRFKISTILIILFCSNLSGQGLQINNIIAQDLIASDKDILEIKFKNQLPNIPFVIAWQKRNNEQFAYQFQTTEDDFILSLSQLKGWEGQITMVGLSLNEVEAFIRKPTFSDQLSIFSNTNAMTPGSVNFSGPYFFYSIHFRWICLSIMFMTWILLVALTRKPAISFFISIAFALALYDIRGSLNRWNIFSDLAKQNYKIEIFKDLDIFIPQAREIIKDKCWTKEPLSGVLNSYCTYYLADLCYKPHRSKIKKDADFIITTTPRKRKVLINHGPYYLVASNTAR